MRDRRNTNLSVSTASCPSNNASPVDAPDLDLAEKGRFLFLPARLDDAPLPSPLIKHAQELQARQPTYRKFLLHSKVFAAIFVLLLGICFIWRFVTTATFSFPSRPFAEFGSHDHSHGISLTGEPEPVIVQDSKGRKRWTISIPANSSFPLRPSQYRNICSKSYQVSQVVRDALQERSRLPRKANYLSDSYYAHDPTYMDVHEVVSQGIFNTTRQSPISVVGWNEQTEPINGTIESRTCGRSLTFILETEEAGFGKSLLSLWLSYSLALREKRSFFIDDSRWQYGSYLSFFPKPPQPSCTPPPPSQVVPCPHQAAHLAVSAATLSETFGAKFHAHYLSSHRTGQGKQRKIFHMARQGYETLFGLSGDDASYAQQRISSIREKAKMGHYPVIGMHIRRGDRHPFEYEFHNDYLPLERFTAAAARVIASTQRPASVNISEPVPLLVASDDPDVVMDPDLLESGIPVRLERAQDRIVLASKRNLPPTVPERQGDSAFVKHVDEVSGWEGGFFASLFRGLGRPNRAHHLTFSSAREYREQVEELLRAKQSQGAGKQLSDDERKAEENAATMRQLVGRGYLLDLEVLGQGGDAVVCAVSSATCRVLAVVMGWDSVKRGNWINVDDGRTWSWDGEH